MEFLFPTRENVLDESEVRPMNYISDLIALACNKYDHHVYLLRFSFKHVAKREQ